MSTDTRRFVALFGALALFNVLAWIAFVDHGAGIAAPALPSAPNATMAPFSGDQLSGDQFVGNGSADNGPAGDGSGGDEATGAAWQIVNAVLVEDAQLGIDRLLVSTRGDTPLDADAIDDLSLEPSTAGRWLAEGPHALAYRFDEAPLPGTAFTVTGGGERVAGRATATAPTPRLVRTRLLSSDARDVEIEVTLDRPAPSSWLAQAMTFGESDDDGVAGTWLTDGAALAHRIRTARPRGERLHLLFTTDGVRRNATIDTPRRFALLGVDDLHALQGVASTATLRFSQPLALPAALDAISVEPAVDGLAITAQQHRVDLRGAFIPGVTYRIRVPGALRSAGGETLNASDSASSIDATLTVRPPRPSVDLPDGSGLLSVAGLRRVTVESVDVPRITVRVIRIHDDLLVPMLRGLRPLDAGRVVATTSFALDGPLNRVHRTTLDLSALVGDARGLFVVELHDERTHWRGAEATVAISDLAPVVRISRDGALVWATGVRDGAPRPNARAVAYGRAGRVLAEAITGADGLASLQFSRTHPDGPLAAIVVRDGDDVILLPTDRGGTPPDGVEVRGRTDPDGLDLMLFAERGVHRPGEAVHISGLLRTTEFAADSETAIAPDLPLHFTLVGPDDRLISELTATTRSDDHGFVTFQLPTSAAGATGTHRLEARLPGSDRPLATLALPIEPFVPATATARIEPIERSDARSPGGEETVRATVRAMVTVERIGGGPVPDARVNAEGRIVPARPQPTGWSTFTFGTRPARGIRRVAADEGTTDADGQFQVALPTSLPAGATGELVWSATITEPGGRSITVAAPRQLVGHRGLVFGCRLVEAAPTAEAIAVPADRPIGMESVLVLADGRASASPWDGTTAIGTISRIEHDWAYEIVGDAVAWRSDEHATIIREFTVPITAIGSPQSVDLDALPPGQYRLAMRCPLPDEVDAPCELDFFVVGPDEDASVERPDRLEMVIADGPVLPGGVVTILTRSPFAGSALFTIETGSVRSAMVREIPRGAGVVELSVPATLRNSATVTGLVVRAVDPTAPSWQAHRAAGAAGLPIDVAAHRTTLALECEPRVAPGAMVTVRGQLDDPKASTALVWAVDEGVLQAAAWTTPDPVLHFHGPRRHGVRHLDARDRLLPDHAGLLALDRIGGDALSTEGSSRHRARNATVDALVIPPTLVQTDDDGTFTWSFEMPAVDGALRVMAVAANERCLGAAEALVVPDRAMRVALTLPRALAPGDEAHVTLRLVNERDAPLVGAIEVDGAILSGSTRLESVTFQPNEEVRVPLTIRAGRVGPLPVSVRVLALDGTVLAERSALTTVRAVAPRSLHVARFQLAPGKSIEIDAPSGFDLDDLARRVVASTGIGAELDRLTELLIDYPYGCAEQTISRLRGLLAIATMRPGQRSRVAPMIESGLVRLHDLQHSDGTIGSWPGARAPDGAATFMAARLVADAEAGDFSVNPRLRAGLVRALDAALRDDIGAARAGHRAMALEALVALDGPRPTWVEVLAHDLATILRHGGPTAGVALAMAAHSSGLDATALRVATASIGHRPDDAKPASTLRFESPTTTAARTLRILRTLDIAVDRRDELEEHLLECAAGPFVTTADAAAILEALATPSAASLLPVGEHAAPRLLVDGTMMAGTDGDAGPLLRGALPAGRRVTLTAPADGPALRLVVTHDGRSSSGGLADHTVDRGLRLHRRWLGRDGENLLDGDGTVTVRAGDLIRVELALATTDRLRVTDVVIADLVPGGFEIEHPGLLRTAPDGGVHLENADRAELRDDRMIVFLTAGETETRVRYALRAVVPGSYAIPPTTAEAMYEPRRRAVTTAGRVEVVR